MQSLSNPVFQSTFTHGFQRRKTCFSPLKREGKLKCANRNLGVAPNRSTNTPKTQIAPFRQHQPETPSLGQLIGQQVKETQRIPCHVLAKRHEVSTDCREEFNEPIPRHPKKSSTWKLSGSCAPFTYPRKMRTSLYKRYFKNLFLTFPKAQKPR